jgi:diguanylate cyclase (GGDEF)-like protein
MMFRRPVHIGPALGVLVGGLMWGAGVVWGPLSTAVAGGALLLWAAGLAWARARERGELEALREDHQETLGLLQDVVVELSMEGVLERASERWGELLGAAPDGRLVDRVHPEDRAHLEALLRGLARGELELVDTRFRVQTAPGGSPRWLEGRFALRRRDGVARGLRGVLHDVTDGHLQAQRIHHLASHDVLTGLPNRARLASWVEQALGRTGAQECRVALVFIDLDHFKQVNDGQGHRVGDELLLAVSQRLRGCLREEDWLARWGGDEFMVLLPEVRRGDSPREVAERLRQAVRSLRLEAWPDVRVTCSIGVALQTGAEMDAGTLFVQAEQALFFAKSQGRDNVQSHGDMHDTGRAFRDFELASRLDRAIRQKLLRVHYQPVVDARSGVVVGVEALARWQDEKYGQVSPELFIPLAEQLGLIRELGDVMLEQSLAWFSERVGSGEDLRLSINVSNRQQVTADFAGSLCERVRRHGLRPEQVKLEITESIAMDGVEAASGLLRALSEEGFLLSIDDFGTGFSSLSQLHVLPVDELKIDRSFVRRLRTREGRVIVKAIVDMAHHLDLVLVAEGVEDAETAEALRELGVEMLQGYHFSRPLAPEDCERFLRPASPLAHA